MKRLKLVRVTWRDCWFNEEQYAPPESVLGEPHFTLEDGGLLVGRTKKGIYLAASSCPGQDSVRRITFIPKQQILKIEEC